MNTYPLHTWLVALQKQEQVICVPPLDCLRSTGFTSDATTQNRISTHPIAGPPYWELPFATESINSRSASFHICLSHPVNHVTLLNMTSLNSEIPLQCSWPPARGPTLKFMNTAFCFFFLYLEYSLTMCFCFLEKRVYVCERAPKLWVPHSHSYASASYQGLLCLIELRSCFPFISQMQWRVILLLPNKTYKTGYTAFKTSTNKKKARLIGQLRNRIMKYGEYVPCSAKGEIHYPATFGAAGCYSR